MNSIKAQLLPLQISTEALQTMVQDAKSRFPNECCGFFYGEEEDIRNITLAKVVDNTKEGDQRRRFEISALDYMKAERFATANNLQLLGIYHSHPNHPAIPSEHDRKQAVPTFSYIILSIQDGEFDHIRSWQLNDAEQFDEESILPQQ
ncbi:MAG: Mov34/MPN/PAD-1 family protein [Bacteroidia bacterium]